ncbi:MAG: xanthine dehydrogenase family protein molybdopterin-binding subunit [Alphaproteobacteria bacterium]
MSAQGIGARVQRVEDPRFLTGRGNYTDDINRPGQTYAWIVRSPHAHARIRGVDTAAAKAAPGVVAVFTGADMQVGSLPCGWQVHSKDGSPMKEPAHPPLVADFVRHVGDQVAVVIAETKAQARDAAEMVEVDYEVLPASTTMTQALAAGAPKVHDGLDDNICYDWELGDKAKTEQAFAGASHVVSLDIVQNRLIPNAIEPRAAIGDYEPSSGKYTLYTTSQNPHVIRLLMGAFVLSIPEHKLRVVAPDVGGGFGSKIYHYAEEAIVTWAAGKVRRPIKWTAERSESFLSDAHGRDHNTTAELALDDSGTFLGLRVKTVANMGAYLSTFAPSIPTYLYGTLLAGVYKTPAIYCEVKAVFTHTVPVDAYRGAGRPEATYLLERLVTKAAKQLGIDQVELRRKNMIQPDMFPYQTPVALQYDVGNYPATMDASIDASGWHDFAQRRKESEARGKLRGIGMSTYVEACGLAPSAVVGSLGARAGLYESANVRVHPTGSVSVYTGLHSHGQGHETVLAQIVNEYLGVPVDSVAIVHGDTDDGQFGMGTYGSRSAPVGTAALVKALDKVVNKAKKIAAHLMEASEADIEFKEGVFTIAGTDKTLPLGAVALQAYVPHNYPKDLEPGLEEQAFYDPLNFSYPNGCHICEVEVDPDTGRVEIVAMTSVDDVGRVLNPMIVEGQTHGGLTQGVGQALLEQCVFDDDGQLVTGSYMDYCMPRADDVPSYNSTTLAVLGASNPLEVKGVGESGAIGSTPAIINAVLDALAPLGVENIQMPATPLRVWQAIQAAKTPLAAE